MARAAIRDAVAHVIAKAWVLRVRQFVMCVHASKLAMSALLTGIIVSALNALHPRQVFAGRAFHARPTAAPVPMVRPRELRVLSAAACRRHVRAMFRSLRLSLHRRSRHASLKRGHPLIVLSGQPTRIDFGIVALDVSADDAVRVNSRISSATTRTRKRLGWWRLYLKSRRVAVFEALVLSALARGDFATSALAKHCFYCSKSGES
jgi:hypothetical protein